MKIANCFLLLAAAALCIQAITNEADLADMSELDSQTGPMDLAENPTKAECATVSRSLPAICTVLGEKSCAAFKSKHNAKCGAFNMEDSEEDNEDIGEDDDQDMFLHAQDDGESNQNDGRGRRGGGRPTRGGLMTTGSFVMTSTHRGHGGIEEDLGDDDEAEGHDEAELEDWDLSNSGKCDEHEGHGCRWMLSTRPWASVSSMRLTPSAASSASTKENHRQRTKSRLFAPKFAAYLATVVRSATS